MLSELTKRTYTNILKAELLPAMGCTEPIAIAYAAAILRDVLGNMPHSVKAGFSGNIIKNVKSVIVPATGGRHGIETAIAAGLISGRPDKKLEVLTVLNKNDEEKIDRILSECHIVIEKLTTGCTFELTLEGVREDGERASVSFSGTHTNITSVTKNGDDVTNKYKTSCTVADGETADYSALSVEGIVAFADSVYLEELRPYLKKQIQLNMAIAEEGLRGNWGAEIGKIILSYGSDASRKARAYAAAGSDARMSG